LIPLSIGAERLTTRHTIRVIRHRPALTTAIDWPVRNDTSGVSRNAVTAATSGNAAIFRSGRRLRLMPTSA
jgi:hypothetical protein